MIRLKPLAALLASSILMLPLAGCQYRHTTVVQPQAQPRPDHRDDHHRLPPPPPPDPHNDHHDDHR